MQVEGEANSVHAEILEESTPRRWRGLYRFAGLERQADIKHFMTKLAEEHNVEITLDEWDILRNESHDLIKDSTWQTVR